MDPWWTEPQAGLVGGLLGSLIGVIYGGLGGGLGGPLAAKGLAKGFVVSLFGSGVVLGALLIGMGAVALVLGQPWHVWFWPVQAGAIVGILCGVLLKVAILPAYQRAEQRRLEAQAVRNA